jgi:hypothetical protein
MSTWTLTGHSAAAHEHRLRYCDRCGATAKFEVVLPSGRNLLFCAHHAYANTDALCEIGAVLPISTPTGETRV